MNISSSASAPIAITGATGNIGGRVARELSAAGMPLRLVVREPSRAPRLPDAEIAQASYGDAAAVRSALQGVDVALMVSAAESEDRLEQHRTFIAAAAEAGVRHVVYTSFLGAAPDATFTLARDHWATEEALRGSGMHWTALRDSFYIDFFEGLVGEDGVIRGPAGDGRVAAVTRADVAHVAATVLRDPAPHAGRTYDLTGPEALTLADVARILTDVTGRDVTFHNETIAEAYESRRRWPAPAWQYDAWVSTYTAIRAGELSSVSDAVEAITGVAPQSFRAYLEQRNPA